MARKILKLPQAKKSQEKTAALPRAEQVRLRIIEAIRSGQFPPGHRVREADVAHWLGVSRTPVREALRRLGAEGMITFESWRGAIVSELDRQQVSEIYATREALEGAAARLAARHIDEAEIEMLHWVLDRCAKDLDDPIAQRDLNRQFHDTIYSAAHNRYLLKNLAQLQDTLALLRDTTYTLPGRAAMALEEHRAIVQAISDHDSDAAEAAARSHIQSAQRWRLRLLLDQESE